MNETYGNNGTTDADLMRIFGPSGTDAKRVAAGGLPREAPVHLGPKKRHWAIATLIGLWQSVECVVVLALFVAAIVLIGWFCGQLPDHSTGLDWP